MREFRTYGSVGEASGNRCFYPEKSRFLNRKSSIPTCKVCGGNAPASQVICRSCLNRADGVHQKYAKIKKSVFRIPPSIKAKKDAIIRVVKQIPLPISRIVLEDLYFDFQAMENPDISGEQYQHGDLLYHKNFPDGHPKSPTCGRVKIPHLIVSKICCNR